MNITLRPLYPREESLGSIEQRAEWPPESVWAVLEVRKLLPLPVSNPVLPSSSQSLVPARILRWEKLAEERLVLTVELCQFSLSHTLAYRQIQN
jgi:hypothetical protein